MAGALAGLVGRTGGPTIRAPRPAPPPEVPPHRPSAYRAGTSAQRDYFKSGEPRTRLDPSASAPHALSRAQGRPAVRAAVTDVHILIAMPPIPHPCGNEEQAHEDSKGDP